MDKIMSMSPEQEVKMRVFRDEWLAVGLNTDPANIEAIRTTIAAFYLAIGKPEPYLWKCESPLTAHLIINLIRANLWANLGDNLQANLWANLGDNLGANLRANLWANLGANKLEYIPTNLWGNLDAYWIGYYAFPHLNLRAMYSDENWLLLERWANIARHSGWIYAFEGVCFICDRPSIIRKNAATRLHCETGPAIAFRDGWNLYYINGVSVSEQVVMRPETITAQQALEEPNAEVRRVMIERMGERFMREANPTILDNDIETSGNIRQLQRVSLSGDEPYVGLSVICPSTGSHYILRVPPNTTTCRQAAAWIAGFDDPDQYRPVFES